MSDAASSNRAAREAALEAVGAMQAAATGLVEYRSNGRVLVIGDHDPAAFAVSCLPAPLSAQILQLDPADDPDNVTIPVAGRDISLSGHLGAFRVELDVPGALAYQALSADIVLDLGQPPLLKMALKPPGYRACSTRLDEIEAVAAELAELVGAFEKPRYFDYDPSICAHGRSGQAGCTRCLDSCPATAIASLGESIEVDPYRCQGGGICAAVCPSGAIRYAYPGLADLLNRIRVMLHAYLDHGGRDPVVAFMAESEADGSRELPENAIPVVLEELACAGLEAWLSALAYGASRVVLVGEASPVSAQLDEQFSIATAVAAALGLPDGVLARHERREWAVDAAAPPSHERRATYAGVNDKRNMAFAAIDALCVGAPAAPVPLPAGAPFGRIVVDAEACTLCMACTSVCPSSAVVAGDERPALLFHEANCVQCGICRGACPENAITLEARLNLDPEERRRAVVLNEQAPFHCVSCGKPFATRNIIDSTLRKLSGHPMFATERARRRLMMCDDCRVIDVAQDDDMMSPFS